MNSGQENYISQASTFINLQLNEPEPDDSQLCDKDSKTENNRTERRKSVENVVSSSHDVIGSSISQALAFTSAMTLPAPNATGDGNPSPMPSPAGTPQSPNPTSLGSTTASGLNGGSLTPNPPGTSATTPSNSTNKLPNSDLPSPQPKISVSAPVNGNHATNLVDFTENVVDKIDEYNCDVNDKDSITLRSWNESPQPPNTPFVRSTSQRSSTGSSERRPNDSRSELNSNEKLDKLDKNEKKKKKTSWYSALYPTYKSRSEDFRRIFKDVPDDERLVVDYSCALQKEILVHGRLYVSQNYLCFYANIFRWETLVCLRWKDVTSITKEKTALVIPNAILVYTATDKLFFTSFGARDKTYLMLFRVWQNALMDKQMTQQEMWQWVHFCYGDELGLTTDDEDYIPPTAEDDKPAVGPQVSLESIIESVSSSTKEAASILGLVPKTIHLQSGSDILSEVSDSTDSEPTSKNRKRKMASVTSIQPILINCTASHEGKQIVNTNLPIHVDALFTLLFTNSKFYVDFHEARQTTDLMSTIWTENQITGQKLRTVKLTVALSGSLGPKSSQVTETQILLPISQPGLFYAIDVESQNANIPYADSFYVTLHYCISKVTDSETKLDIFANIKFRKSVWGLVKGMIEKSVWSGLDDHFTSMVKALLEREDETTMNTSKRKTRRTSRRPISSEVFTVRRGSHPTVGRKNLDVIVGSSKSSGNYFPTDYTTWLVFIVLLMLVFLNAMLYVKLWALEDEASSSYSQFDINSIKQPPKSHDEWLKLLQAQEKVHNKEVHRWHKALRESVDLLRRVEESLSTLQLSIHPNQPRSIVSNLESVIGSGGAPSANIPKSDDL